MADDTTSVLADAARSAGRAPSVLNTQPWHWRVHNETIELSSVPSRRLQAFDPSGRQLTLSCGAALHHARVALAAGGWQLDIDRMPEGTGSTLLARVTITGQIPVTPEAQRRLETTRVRQTDRRPVPDEEISTKHLDELRLAAEAEHGWLHTLRRNDAFDLATAASQAAQMEAFGPDWRTELDYWADGPREGGLGIPRGRPTGGTAPDHGVQRGLWPYR